MKNILILLILLISSNIYAQPPVKKAEMKEKIKSLKISFITENLELTSEEAQQFWPVYNNYESRIIKLRHEDGSVNPQKLPLATFSYPNPGVYIVNLNINDANTSIFACCNASFDIKINDSYWILIPCYAIILFYALKGHKLGLN